MKCLHTQCGLIKTCEHRDDANKCSIHNSWLMLNFEMDGAAALLSHQHSLTEEEKLEIIAQITKGN